MINLKKSQIIQKILELHKGKNMKKLELKLFSIHFLDVLKILPKFTFSSILEFLLQEEKSFKNVAIERKHNNAICFF